MCHVAERAELDYGLFAFEAVSGKVNGTDITRPPSSAFIARGSATCRGVCKKLITSNALPRAPLRRQTLIPSGT